MPSAVERAHEELNVMLAHYATGEPLDVAAKRVHAAIDAAVAEAHKRICGHAPDHVYHTVAELTRQNNDLRHDLEDALHGDSGNAAGSCIAVARVEQMVTEAREVQRREDAAIVRSGRWNESWGDSAYGYYAIADAVSDAILRGGEGI